MNSRILTQYLAVALSVLMPVLFFLNDDKKASAADVSHKSLSIALIGDSYTSGNGAGSYTGDSAAVRSNKNWGNYYASWLNTRSVKTTLTNLAYSGNTSDLVRDKQVPQVPANTNLVMLTVGGNDAEFSSIVKQCFAAGLRSPAYCRERVEFAKSQMSSAIRGTKEIFQNLQNRLSPGAEIVLVGYPLLSLDETYTLKQCLEMDTYTDSCIRYDTYDAAKAVREAGQEFNRQQAALVASWNVNSSIKATFVDTIQSSFATHEPDPHATAKNSQRWINEFFETEGEADNSGNINSKFSLNQNNWYHPNLIGHRKIGLDIINQVGVPSSAKPITTASSNVDIAFVIDTTGSMGGVIGQVKQDIGAISSQIQQQTNSARFALIDFQDHPISGGSPSDYPSKIDLPFTYSHAELLSTVQSLQLGDGGDMPESVYSGAMAALSLDWRPGVRKVMIIIGDAPAKDPEPVTGYTWQQVAARAYEIDPVEIYSIDSGNGNLSSNIKDLVERTGGQNLAGGDISQLVVNAIDHSANKPFGWIQGPYVIKAGETLELDGRGSYAVDGEIASIAWDLNGDGEFETPSSELLYSHQFTDEFSGTIGIKIIDSSGRVGLGSTQLDATDDGDTVPRPVDNCPLIANLSQTDDDGDGIGDDCDDDIGLPTTDIAGVTVLDGTEVEEPTTPPKATCNTLRSFIQNLLRKNPDCGNPKTQLLKILFQAIHPKVSYR